MTYREAIDDTMRCFYREHTAAKRRRNTIRNTGRDTESAQMVIPGNLLHISLPAGTEFQLLDLFELTSPEGISLEVRLPFLQDSPAASALTTGLGEFLRTVEQAGGTIEVTPL